MSSFTDSLVVEVLQKRLFKVVQRGFKFYLDNGSNSILINIPLGFVTDFATTPRFLWSIFPPIDRYSKASVIHDYLYSLGLLSKKDADRAFYNGMKALGIPGWKRYLMYQAVKYFGVGNY